MAAGSSWGGRNRKWTVVVPAGTTTSWKRPGGPLASLTTTRLPDGVTADHPGTNWTRRISREGREHRTVAWSQPLPVTTQERGRPPCRSEEEGRLPGGRDGRLRSENTGALDGSSQISANPSRWTRRGPAGQGADPGGGNG